MGTLGQFVALTNTSSRPWYGARLIVELYGPTVRVTTLSGLVSARNDPALFVSVLSSRQFPELLRAFELARIHPVAELRDETAPIVIVGGGACYNPEPIAAFADVVCVGDGEPFVRASIAALRDLHTDRATGAGLGNVRSMLEGLQIDADAFRVEWPTDARLAWDHILPIGEEGRARLLRAHAACRRFIAAEDEES